MHVYIDPVEIRLESPDLRVLRRFGVFVVGVHDLEYPDPVIRAAVDQI